MKRFAPYFAVIAAALLVAAQGCSVTVIDPGTTSTGGGSATTTSTASSGGGDAGTKQCSNDDVSSCSCREGKLRIKCAPKDGKTECVCSYGATFSGICFEEDASLLCDFDNGCCANYFSGH